VSVCEGLGASDWFIPVPFERYVARAGILGGLGICRIDTLFLAQWGIA